MLSNPTSRSLSVVCLVKNFPKWVFSPKFSSLRLLVFDFIEGLNHEIGSTAHSSI